MSQSDWLTVAFGVLGFSGVSIKGTIIYVKTNTGKMKAIFSNPYVQCSLFMIVVAGIIYLTTGEKSMSQTQTQKTASTEIPRPEKTSVSPDINTIHNSASIASHLRYKKTSHIPIISKADTAKGQPKKDTVRNNGQFNLPNATFNAPSQFGNGNKQYNLGKLDRLPTDVEANTITSWLPDKNKPIQIDYQSPDAESKKYSETLKGMLDIRGYKNITFFPHLSIGTPQQSNPIFIDTAHYVISVELNGH